MVVQQILLGFAHFSEVGFPLELQGWTLTQKPLFLLGKIQSLRGIFKGISDKQHIRKTHATFETRGGMSKRSNDHDQHLRNYDQSQGHEKKNKSVSKTLASMRFKWIKTKLAVAT